MNRKSAIKTPDTLHLRLIAAVASALLLYAAFPPLEITALVWMALCPLFFIARFSRPAVAFKWGWLSGTLYWLMSTGWILSMGPTRTGNAVASSFWICLSLYLGVYVGAFTFCASLLLKRVSVVNCSSSSLRRHLAASAILIMGMPVLWIGFEYLRSVLFTGMPWNGLGISLYRHLPLIQIAEWGGVYAVSGLIVIVNTSFVLAVWRFIDFNRINTVQAGIPYELIFAVVLVVLLKFSGENLIKRSTLEERERSTVEILLVQPNIPQCKKYRAQFATAKLTKLETLTMLGAAGIPALDLIVWPETALPSNVIVPKSRSGILVERVTSIAPVLTGTMEREELGDEKVWFNASMLFDRKMDLPQVYRKQHPVPFGEYTPFESLFRRLGLPDLRSLTVAAAGPQPLFDINEGSLQFAVLICFEDVFEELSRNNVRKGAQFLVTQTNDAWFDPSAESLQHMSHAVFRCVENRVPMARCANTGVTCSIDQSGRVRKLTDSTGRVTGVDGYQRVTLNVLKSPFSGTIYTRFGDWMLSIPCLVLILLFLLSLGCQTKT